MLQVGQRDEDWQQHGSPGRGSADSVSVQHSNGTDQSDDDGEQACKRQNTSTQATTA